jgi:hypothetical protein
MIKITPIILNSMLKVSHISFCFFPIKKSVKTGIKIADNRPATKRCEIVKGIYVEIFIASER